MSLRRSLGAARRRVCTPVRLTIHASSTPSRPARAEFGTTSAGLKWPSPMMLAVRWGAKRAPLRVASRAIVRRSGGSVALCIGGLQRRGLDLRAVGEDALAEAGEHLPGADLDEAGDARLVQREHRLAPADRARQRGGELGADVGEGPGARARDDGEAGLAELDRVERLAEGLYGGLHQRRVERAGDVELERAAAVVAGVLLRGREIVAGAREDDLAGRVVVGDRDAGVGGDLARLLVRGADEGEHRARVVGLGHQAPAEDDELERVVAVDDAGGRERGQLAEAVAGGDAGLQPEGVVGRDAGAEDRGLRE